MFSFLLVPLYTEVLPNKSDFGEVIILFSYVIFANVFLSYGMETAFFRFNSKHDNKSQVFTTALQSIFWTTTFFLVAGLLFRGEISQFLGVSSEYTTYILWILALDAWVVIPFSKLRAEGKAMLYAIIKIFNVSINLGLNLFFLIYLPLNFEQNQFFSSIYFENFHIGYIFLATLVASLITFIILSYNYFNFKVKFSFLLWRKMLTYGFPILIGGIAFAINENFDKILLEKMGISKSEIGAYAACYKLGVFMVLFRTAYTLGIEPFFFSHSANVNAKQTYANVTKYFVIVGALFSLFIIINLDLFKHHVVRNDSYFSAIAIVPIIILANFFLGIYTNLSVWYKLVDKTYVGAVVSIIGATITVGINYIFIPYYGYMASALATIITYSTMCFISYHWGQKKYPIPYDKTAIKLYLLITTVFVFSHFYLFRENYLIGYIMFTCLALLIFFREKDKFRAETQTIEEEPDESEIISSNDSQNN